MRSDIQIPHCLQDVCTPQEETSQEEIKLKTVLGRNSAESEKDPNYHFCCNLLLKACGLTGPLELWESRVRWLCKVMESPVRHMGAFIHYLPLAGCRNV